MIRVLFVDEDARVLERLEPRLHGFRGRWDMHFQRGAVAALEFIEKTDLDVVVSDTRLPTMDAPETLKTMHERQPQLVRLILTGYPGQVSLLGLLPATTESPGGPCEVSSLEQAIMRCCALSKRLSDPAVQAAIGEIGKLPALPKLYWSLVSELDDPEADSKSISRIIEQDVAMTARVLQLANSAYFSPGRQLRHIREAVTYLGLLPLQSMVLAMEMFHAMSDFASPAGFSLTELQNHSLRTAQIASGLVKDAEERQTAFSAGMLHDIGKLVLALGLPDRHVEVKVRAAVHNESNIEAEFGVLGCTHAEIGAHMLSVWGLPTEVIEAVAFHHAPGLLLPARFGVVGAVHVANALAHQDVALERADVNEPLLDQEYLRATGMAADLTAWRDHLATTLH